MSEEKAPYPALKPEGWEPMLSVREGFGADLPDTLILPREFLEDMSGPLKAALREYVNLLQAAEEFRKANPILAALVELIQERNPESMARWVQAPGDTWDITRSISEREQNLQKKWKY